MLYVYTLFDTAHDSRPLITAILHKETKSLQIYQLYVPKSGRTLYDIEADVSAIRDRLVGSDIVVNDLKQHLIAFNLGHDQIEHMYDIPMPAIGLKTDAKANRMATAAAVVAMAKMKLETWHIIRANAAVVYAYLQRKGVLFGYKLEYPIWDLETYSGRSRSVGFNVQGLGIEPLANTNNDPIFLHFDWVAADIRAISIISDDMKLHESFVDSDPYTYLINNLNIDATVENQLNREEGKAAMLAAVYSLDDGSPVFDFYAGVRRWMAKSKARLLLHGSLPSILGRQFYLSANRNQLSAFNAAIQGTVAHAMQICIRKVWDLYPDNILTDSHDSLVVTCTQDKKDIRSKVAAISRIMVQPFHGILKDNPQFPLVVSIGKKYKQWSTYKRYNNYESIE